MHAAAVRFELHVPESRSLKAKRAVLRPIVDGLRHRMKSRSPRSTTRTRGSARRSRSRSSPRATATCREILATVERHVADAPDIELLDVETAWLEVVTVSPDRSPRKYPRTLRVNEVVRETLADQLERMEDPRLELVTITGVDVSPDLRHANVFYSALGRPTTRRSRSGCSGASAPPAGRLGS